MSGFSRSDSAVGPGELKSGQAPPGPSGLVTAATVIARSDVPGEMSEPRAELVEVVSGGDDGDDAGGGRCVERAGDEVARRLHLRLPDREVDHVHAVLHCGLDRGDDLGGVAVEPDAASSGRSAPCSCRCTRGARPPRPSCSRSRVPAFPAAMPATWVACPDSTGSNGLRAYFQVVPAGAKARATITFAVVYAACPFGKPAGIVYPAGEK